MLAGNGNAGRVNLGKTGVAEEGAAFVSAIGGGDVATACVGGEEKDVAVTASGKNNGITGKGIDLAGAKVARDNSLRMTVDQDQVEHFRLRKHFHGAKSDLATQCLIGAKQKLLTGLTASIKGPRYLRTAERTIGQNTAVFAGKGDPLLGALIDDEIPPFR